MHYRFLALTLALAPALPGASEWLKLNSANFELYTTAGAREGRLALKNFEQVRDFFMKVKSSQVTTRLPVTIVMFRNAKEYKPYSIGESAVAYYTGDEHRDYIVMSGAASENFPVAIHEYMHLLVRHSGLNLPPWLNEGYAEVHSTLRPLGGQVLIGSIPEGRTYALQQFQWFPLQTLLGITHSSPEYNEKNRSSVFYSQSWMLTHMLMLSDVYSPRFAEFVAKVSESGSAEGAFRAVYAKTVAEVEKDLKSYYRGAQLKGMLFKERLQKMDEEIPAEPAPDLEVGLSLARLTSFAGRKDEALRSLEELSGRHPSSWQVAEALAHTYWQRGEMAKTKQHFGRAVDLGATSWKTYWDYARMLQDEPERSEERISVAQRALKLNPALTEARLLIGFEYFRARRYNEAMSALMTIKQVPPDRAGSFFLTVAHCAYHLKNLPEAKIAASRAREYAKDPQQIAAADELIRFIETGGAPRTMVRAEPPRTTPPGIPELQADGVLTEVVCSEDSALIHLKTKGKPLVLLIRDPGQVEIRGEAGATRTFACGRQNEPAVSVGYIAKEDPRNLSAGDVRWIEFRK